MQQLTAQQQLDKCRATFRSWVNWKTETDCLGLLLGLGDYYIEIAILEEELNIPVEQRFKLTDYLTW